MPTYEYICEKCGFEFETFQSISAPPLKRCPPGSCPRQPWGRGRVKRKISAGAGLLFKGSGFYITDYRSEGYKQAAQKDAAPAPSAGAGSKSAGKPESKSVKPPAKT
ncbi:MAG TPA: FmdB family zinc ribbon protein [Candidatus Acidoferrum sp.]|nr:FmdB family zinc ribbon protein [Candidatus Acidoferrum sp.]